VVQRAWTSRAVRGTTVVAMGEPRTADQPETSAPPASTLASGKPGGARERETSVPLAPTLVIGTPGSAGERETSAPLAGSDVVPIRERETTPAPPSAELTTLSSGRPTSVPDFDFAAVAAGASLRHDDLPRLPLDVAVPSRTGRRAPPDLEVRLAFLLFHCDERSSLAEIAESAALPLGEVQTAFFELMALGLVELRGQRAPGGVPTSGERRSE
jgi:hypothetical protein